MFIQYFLYRCMLGTDSTVHAFKLQQVAEPTKVATSGGGKKKTAAPVPLSSLKLEIVKLFSIQHDAKINAVVAVFGPDSVITTSDSIAPATTTTDNVEHSEGNVKESAASEATSGQMRKVYIADISNDITFYTNRP